MIQLDLNYQETETLASMLDSYLSELRMEIADTDRMEFREGLKDRKRLLMKILDALGHPIGSYTS